MNASSAVEDFIQNQWREELCPGLNGVLFSNGELALMDCTLLLSGGRTQVQIRPLSLSTLTSILEENKNIWVFLTEMASYSWEEGNLRLSCGGGSMGGDGYVAAVRLTDEHLVWIAFFDCSNPFQEVKVIGNEVTAVSTLGHTWRFPFDHPEKVTVQP